MHAEIFEFAGVDEADLARIRDMTARIESQDAEIAQAHTEVVGLAGLRAALRPDDPAAERPALPCSESLSAGVAPSTQVRFKA